jgi:single-strand DNA-binding protein
MASFNRVILLGNLTRDPQLRYLPSNVAVCEFGLAVNRRYRDRDGNQKEDVCFVDISAFGKQAETINQYMSKGRPILIEGRLKLDQWTGQDGTKRSKLSVVAEGFQFVGAREGAPTAGAGPRETGGPAARGGPAPEAAPAGPPAGDYGGGDEPPRPDDIPF